MEIPLDEGWINVFDKSLQIWKENGKSITINEPTNLRKSLLKLKKMTKMSSNYQNAPTQPFFLCLHQYSEIFPSEKAVLSLREIMKQIYNIIYKYIFRD